MRRIFVLAGLIAIGGVSTAARLQQQPRPPQPLEIQKVKDNLYVIMGVGANPATGGGGNVAAFVTASGVVLIDAKLPGYGQKILEQVKTVTEKPVTMIIATHTHGDHVGSIPEFPAQIEVVAHENCKTGMEKMPAFQGSGQQFLPKRTYKDKLSLMGGKDKIDLYYFGAGHTSGDTFVVFPALRAMHAGDLFAGKGAPIMDTGNGGSGIAYPGTLAKAAAAIKNVDIVIPGHSAVTDWNAFKEYSEFMKELVTAVQLAAKSGRTEEEAAKMLKLPEKFKDYNMGRAQANVSVIYAELKR